MEKRAVIALALSLVIFVAFGYVQQHFMPPAPPKVEDQAAPKAESKAEPVAAAPVPVVAETQPGQAARPPQDVMVETPLYQAVFTEMGGRLKSFKLKKFWERLPFIREKSFSLWFFSIDIERYQKIPAVPTNPQQLVEAMPVADLPLEVAWETDGQGPRGPVRFQASAPAVNLTEGKATLTFSHRGEDGITLIKTLTFQADAYRIDMAVTVKRDKGEAGPGTLVTTLSSDHAAWKEKAAGLQGFVGLINKSREEVKSESLKEPKTLTGQVGWGGLEQGYFLEAMVPLEESKVSIALSETKAGLMTMAMKTPVASLGPGEVKQFPFALYFGPKDIKELRAFGYDLEKAVDFGWFHFLAMPCLAFLRFVNGYLHNYGWAIVILTVLIRILFIYPNHKSFKSMQDMQKLQPKIAKLREKYKDNREEMNKELMSLYRTYKVNPAGGCLPMVLQLPVFIALYNLLGYAIELRHAPFIATLPFTDIVWLADLSAKDPLLITPIIMGVTMFYQQKMTPSPGDPTQAKIMLFMPILFTFMFLNFASGLVLYWLLNNVLSIIQQYYTNKYLS